MHDLIWVGVLLAMLGGVSNGSFALPMKLMPKWKWENTWLVYSIIGMVVVPWIVAWLLTPNLGAVVREAPLLLICGFGLAWGIGSVFFGLGINKLGLGLGLALIMGIIAGIGSLVPMLVQDPAKASTRAGAFIIAGNIILIVGIAFCARAGGLREKMRSGGAPAERSSRTSDLVAGLVIAVLSGLFSAMLNFGFTFGQQAQDHAIRMGASPRTAGIVIFAIAVSTGFLANLGFCIWKLGRSGWSAFVAPGTGVYWLGPVIMGVLWFSSWIVYVIGASYMGPIGGVIGWPVLMGGTIVVSNIAGWLTGEWKGADRKMVSYLIAGIAIILGSIVVIAQGNA